MTIRKGFVKLGLVFCLMSAGTLGCLPQIQREVIGPGPIPTPPETLPSLPIENRVAGLEKLLGSGILSEEDSRTASRLLDGYRTARGLSQNHPGREQYRRIIDILLENLGDLEEKYLFDKKPEASLAEKTIRLFSRQKRLILDDYLSGDYQAVVNHTIDLRESLGEEALTPDIGLVFAISLAKRGMLGDAIRVGGKIVRELEGKPDLIHLRARLIEWHLALGQRERALKTYEKLVDNLDERREVIHGVERRVMEREDKIPVGEESPQERPHALTTDTDAPESLRHILREVDGFVTQKEFQRAKLLILRQRIEAQEESEIRVLDQALKSVEMAEKRAQEGGTEAVPPENEVLRQARILIEQEKFEEAIKRLEDIQGDRETIDEAGTLKAGAEEKLIQRERNRAAKFFLMAKNTGDSAKKEAYLLSSKQILEGLIRQYPSSHLVQRLRDNLQKVEEELGKMKKGSG